MLFHVKFLRALRARAPVDDLSLINDEALIGCSCQARCITNGTVDICKVSTTPADHVMVVVSYPSFIARRRTRGLNSAQDPTLYKSGECVVDGLAGNGPDTRAHQIQDGIRGGVLVGGDGF